MAKKAGKKSKKEKSEKSGAMSGPKPEEEIDELSRQFYLNQIKDLEHKVNRYQEKCDLLTLENNSFQTDFKNEKEDKKEIVDYLRKKNEISNKKIEELNNDMLDMQNKMDQEREKSNRKYQDLKKDMNDEIDKLRNENTLLASQVTSLRGVFV